MESLREYSKLFNMKIVWQSLEYSREKIKDSSPSTHVQRKTLNLVISRCCFADDGKEMDTNEKRTCRAWKATVFRPQNMQICGVLVPVAFVVSKASYWVKNLAPHS